MSARDLATRLADSLGDILKHDDDHGDAVDLLEQELDDAFGEVIAERDALRRALEQALEASECAGAWQSIRKICKRVGLTVVRHEFVWKGDA